MMRFALVLSILFSGSVYAANTAIAERSFEECQALAISRGVPSRYTHKVESHSCSTKLRGRRFIRKV